MFWFLIFLAIGIVAGVGLSNARTPEIRLPRPNPNAPHAPDSSPS